MHVFLPDVTELPEVELEDVDVLGVEEVVCGVLGEDVVEGLLDVV